jgi:hypothetical protein
MAYRRPSDDEVTSRSKVTGQVTASFLRKPLGLFRRPAANGAQINCSVKHRTV